MQTHTRQLGSFDPGCDLVCGCIDNGNAWRILIMSENAFAIRRNGNALDALGYGESW